MQIHKLLQSHHEPIRIIAENCALPLHAVVAVTHAYTLAAFVAGVIAIAYLAATIYQVRAKRVRHDA